jgi:two-component sensor histidine kinase
MASPAVVDDSTREGTAPARAVRVTWTIIACYVTLALATLPIASRPGPQIPGMIPFFATGVLVTGLATSFLLFKHVAETRTWSVLLLGCAYLYSGLMSIAHLLTFPGAVLAQDRVIGTQDQTTAWIFIAWVAGYAALTLIAVLAASYGDPGIAAERVGNAIPAACGAVLVGVVVLVLVATSLHDRLPALIQGSRWSPANLVVNYLSVGMLAFSVGLIVLRLKPKEELFLWVALALTAIAVANVLATAGGGRYTIGWSLGRLSWVVSTSVLFLYFMRQYARQQGLVASTNRLLEQRVAERTAELRKSLEERDLLLREVYHRVKNNLQLVDSLLGLQASRLGPGDASNGLNEVRRRVNALGLVHQQLMQSADLSSVDLGAFLGQLARNLSAAAGSQHQAIRVKMADAQPLLVTLDFAVPLGLLAAELLSQALNQTGGLIAEIDVNLSSPDMLTMTIVDGGASSAVLADPSDERLVRALVAQLDAQLVPTAGRGTTLRVALPGGRGK